MSAPDVALSYARELAKEKRAALASVKRSWRMMGDDFDAAWSLAGPRVLAAVTGAQAEVAALADRYVADVAPLTVSRLRDPDYAPAVSAWIGVAGDGRPVESLAHGAVIQAKTKVAQGATTHQALKDAGKWLTAAMGTVLADTHRSVEQVAIRSRRTGLYTRMLTGPSNCGRCVILAGRKYRSAQAFLRHPQCDCVHIPASEDLAGDLTTDPHAYLDSLSDKDLIRVLGSKDNARAWRDGADVNQLVNAYRRKGSVQKAQLYGNRVLSFTDEGRTRRGRAYKAMAEHHSAFRKQLDVKDGRYRRTQIQRLMPSSIYELAKDPQDAQRLLRTYGWIL